jgi:hypothetical protein
LLWTSSLSSTAAENLTENDFVRLPPVMTSPCQLCKTM